ncbi:lanthionine synthetase C family protein [Chitinophaga japonensis]|uniref:Lanthionine synthetase-like protein n=1 Tax=Chitinophaga japonensis TaxID=104662 RepID=A0A562SJB0_CHIJA|nr:lanthionine synthetase C family protein [Chitinophaga japonensis]TWI81064.1 lanthionine synthetase-like protein [Chitinophaga japonensis]
MQQIAQKQLDRLNALLESHVSSNDTFLKGRLGLIYYYFHLYKVTEKAALKHKAEDLLQQVFSNINSTIPTLIGAALSTGGAGLGFAVNSMYRQGLLEFEVDNEFERLDEYLFKTACDLISEDNTDFLHGALGVIHYFTERQRTTPQVACYLDTLVEKVCLNAVQEDAGCWFRNTLMRVDGEEVINFSMSHGLCGILLVLLNAYDTSAHRELIQKTVNGGIQFILKHKIDVDFSRNEYSFFPFMMKRGASEISAPNRMGWCYGDLNEVLLFYRAGKRFNDDSLLRLADLIGMQSMMRRDECATMVSTSCFCHGTAGLAQFCKTLYEERGLEIYREGYECWIEKTILLLDEELEKDAYAGKEGDMLEGVVGIAFTLLSYVTDMTLRWNKALLL